MQVKGLVWLGTRTSNFKAMVNLYQNILGFVITYQEPGFVVMDLPNGDQIEVFGDDSPYNTFFTSPVAGFLVDDIAFARAEMERQGNRIHRPHRICQGWQSLGGFPCTRRIYLRAFVHSKSASLTNNNTRSRERFNPATAQAADRQH